MTLLNYFFWKNPQQKQQKKVNSWQKRLFVSFFLLGVLLIFIVNGCQPNKTLQPLRIGITTWPGFDIALYAQKKGLFQKRGLKVDFVRFENQQDSSRAVLRGALDAAFVSLWDVMQVDPGNDNPVFVMVTNISHGSDGIVAQPGIKSVKELRGKRIGAKFGTVNHLILLEALDLKNVNPSQVNIEDISNDEMAERMLKKRLDAAVLWQPLLGDTAKKIKGNIVFTTQEVDSLVIDGLVSRSSLLASKKDELTQFILAWFDLMHAVDTQPTEVFAVVGQELGQSGESFASDYGGLKKGDIPLNERMFAPNGRLKDAAKQMVKLLKEDSRHGRIIREDVDINSVPVKNAIALWKPSI
jgi:NitT/TauT family transport system substrate-binding protein